MLTKQLLKNRVSVQLNQFYFIVDHVETAVQNQLHFRLKF